MFKYLLPIIILFITTPAHALSLPTSTTIPSLFAKEERLYTITVLKDTPALTINTSASTGDIDIYLSKDTAKDFKLATWKSITDTSTERISLLKPAVGTYYLTVRSFTPSTNVKLGYTLTNTTPVAPATPVLTKNTPVTNSLSAKQEKLYTFTVPATTTNLTITTTGLAGDADLYLTKDVPLPFKSATWKSILDGSNEKITLAKPTAGRYYLILRAFTPTINTVLTLSYTSPNTTNTTSTATTTKKKRSGGGGGGGGGSSSSPSTPAAVNGSCGTSNGQTLSSIPSTNLCTLGTASSVTDSSSYTWTCAGSNGGTTASCSASKTVLDTGSISAIITPSRVSGVAPLSVFFDSTQTTSSETSSPFHDLEYTWNFGDALSGTWSQGSRSGASKNTAKGPVAAHVFETPGTYSVTVTVTDGTDTTSETTQITVTDPDTIFASNTICFSTSGNFTGCPSGAVTMTTSNFATAVNSNQGTKKRLLFRRGETFTSTPGSGVVIDTTGPGLIGAYGTGAAPKWMMPTGVFTLSLGDQEKAGIKDWRVMDIEMDGQSLDTSAIGGGGGMNQILLMRINVHDSANGIIFTPSLLDYYNGTPDPLQHGHTIWDELSIVEVTMDTISGGLYNSGHNGAYIGASRFVFMGNNFDSNGGGEHVMRTPYVGGGVISNNYLARPASGKSNLKLHAPGQTGTGVVVGQYTENVVISDNTFYGGVNDWPVVLAPQNTSVDERLRNIIFERNYLKAGSWTSVAVVIRGPVSFVTLRNNIANLTEATAGTGATAFIVIEDGVGPLASDIAYLNNTVYTSASHNATTLTVDSTITNVTVKNNLMYAPSGGTVSVIAGTGGSGYIATNNTSNAQAKNTSPEFLSVPSSSDNTLSSTDFKIGSGSYGAGAGVSVSVFSDFFLNSQTTVRSIGATIP